MPVQRRSAPFVPPGGDAVVTDVGAVCLCLRQSHAVVVEQLEGRPMCDASTPLAMVSSASGAGVNALWESLVRVTRRDTVDKAGIAVHKASIR